MKRRVLVPLVGSLGIAVAVLPGPVVAQEQSGDVIGALTQAAIAGAINGDETAQGMLRLLLDLPEPWQAVAFRAVEHSDLIPAMHDQRAGGSRRVKAGTDVLLRRLADLQGAQYRDGATQIHADGAEIVVDLSGQPLRWLQVDGVGPSTTELYVWSPDCTPDITAFAGATDLPAAPLAGAVRFSEHLSAIAADGSVTLRVTQGTCEEDAVRLMVRTGSARVGQQETDSGDRTATLETDRVNVVRLGRRPATQVRLPTERGYVYEVYAAPLSAGVDPALVLADPLDPAAVADADDDSGWELGARLEAIIGTGREERIAVMRASDEQGDAAVLVQRRAVPVGSANAEHAVALTPVSDAWIQVELSAGRWDLRLGDVAEGMDPAMLVHDALTGAVMQANDDESDETLAPRVHLEVKESTTVLIRLISLEGEGTASFSVRPDGRASAESSRREVEPRAVST